MSDRTDALSYLVFSTGVQTLQHQPNSSGEAPLMTMMPGEMIVVRAGTTVRQITLHTCPAVNKQNVHTLHQCQYPLGHANDHSCQCGANWKDGCAVYWPGVEPPTPWPDDSPEKPERRIKL